MKITQIIEGISPTVYHTTSIDNAYQILKSGSFRLSSASSAREADIGGDNAKYWMSTARSLRNSFSDNMPTSITFEMNGTSLSHNHSGKAVNYFSGKSGNNEMEDRVFSNKRMINNAGKHITKVFLRSNDGLITKGEYLKLQEIVKIVKDMGLNMDVRIKNYPAALSQFTIDNERSERGEQESLPDPTPIIEAIIKVANGEINRFSKVKELYPRAVKYLIGQNPREFEERIRDLLSIYSTDDRIDPLMGYIRNKFSGVRKFANHLFKVTGQI